MVELSRQAAPSQEHAIAALGPWFHNLHLPTGVQTAPQHPLGDFPSFKWHELGPSLPSDLTGWTVLDVGCNAGYYSFELAKRGAHVVGIDHEPLYLDQARWALRQFGLEGHVEFRQQAVYDLGRSSERYDLVLFMGLFYHLRHPLLALDLLAARTKRLMVFQTLTMPGNEVVEAPDDMPLLERQAMRERGWPTMAFIEKKVAADLTNWWAPNHSAVLAMLRTSGLEVVAEPGHEMYVCEPVTASRDGSTELVQAELTSIFGPPEG
jgi:tRNA (mo5U34)-methyltransferase